MTATVERKKVRYLNKDTGKFAWAFPEDLPEYAVNPQHAEPDPDAGRYDELIESYLGQLREARDLLKRSAGVKRVEDDCMMKIDQFGAAIENALAAESITDEAANFAHLDHEFSFRLPPRVSGDYTTEPKRSQSRVYMATDPLEIAYLRRMVKNGELIEIGLNERVAVPTNNEPPYITDVKAWFQMLDRKQVNP